MNLIVPKGDEKNANRFFSSEPPLWLVVGTMQSLFEEGYDVWFDGDRFAVKYYK